jgi:hypothetical protein
MSRLESSEEIALVEDEGAEVLSQTAFVSFAAFWGRLRY